MSVTDAEVRISNALLKLGVESVGETISPYLEHHLAEHVGSLGLWSRLAAESEVLAALDPEAVKSEALRTGFGRQGLPAAITVAMVAGSDLAAVDPAARRLVRDLAAHRLRLAIPGDTDPALQWCRLRRVTPHVSLTGHIGPSNAVAFGTLPDGRVLLATGGSDETVRLWDPATETPVGDPLSGHTDEVDAVAFGTLPDGRVLLATASGDEMVRLWDPATGIPVGDPLSGHTDEVVGVAFGTLPDGRVLLATGSWDGGVLVWDIDPSHTPRAVRHHVLAPSTPHSLVFGPTTLYVACDDGIIALNLPESPSEPNEFTSPTSH